MMHLDAEMISRLADGDAPGRETEAHLAECPKCREEVQAVRKLRDELRSLPLLNAPPEAWAGIVSRLPARREGMGRRASRLGSGRFLRHALELAAVFVLGLGLGRTLPLGGKSEPADQTAQLSTTAVRPVSTASDATPAELTQAMEDVRQRGAEYEAALRRLEAVARQTGTPIPRPEDRLLGLDALADYSRQALSTDPTDPVLNAYLFAALNQRADVVRQVSSNEGSKGNGHVLWR